MTGLTGLKEKIFPGQKKYTLFTELGIAHEVTATVYTYPFRHVVINNVLPVEHYELLVADFRRIYSKGLSAAPDRERFSRFDLYDLYSYIAKPTLEPPLGNFFLESFFQMLENVLRRSMSRDTFVTHHHHTPNPVDNYIHNDYVYEYFADDPLENGVNPWYFQCDKLRPSEKSRSVVRAATSIFYLDNDWSEGMGGETAIFATKDPSSLVRTVAPMNNRLVAFDITPVSFHSYLRCSMSARNSLAQWYYTSEADVSSRFPGVRPGGWEHDRM